MLYNLHFFPSKYRLFYYATLFGFWITRILNTECAKIWKKFRRQKVKHDVLLNHDPYKNIFDLLFSAENETARFANYYYYKHSNRN